MEIEFTSGMSNPPPRSDCMVRYAPESGSGLEIQVKSKVETLYGKSIRRLAADTLETLQISRGRLELSDAGALPFLIQARIEAAVREAFPDRKLACLPERKHQAAPKTERDRFRRSRLYLPGNQPKLMLNAGLHKPDAIILDLEDSVAAPEKLSARLIVRNALRTLDFFGAERMVRINQGELGHQDISEIAGENVHVILIPKAESALQIRKCDEAAKAVRKDTEPVLLLPILESAAGILNAREIASACPNVVALAIGLEDYTADIGTERTASGHESFFARSMAINAARAAKIQAIGTVFSDVGDMTGLCRFARESKELGFDGLGCIHPRQIRPIHEEFRPEERELEKAKRIVLAFRDAQKRGLGVVSLGSKMIDPPVVKRALKTTDLAVKTGQLEATWENS